MIVGFTSFPLLSLIRHPFWLALSALLGAVIVSPARAENSPLIPLVTYVESADIILQGVITEVTPLAPIQLEQALEGRKPATLVSLKIRVINSRPAVAGPTVELLASTDSGQFTPGKPLLLILNGHNGVFRPRAYPLEDDQGVMQADDDGPRATVNLLLGDHPDTSHLQQVPLEPAWEYLRALYDRTHGGGDAHSSGAATGPKSGHELKDRLTKTPPAAASLTLATLALTPDSLPAPNMLASALETRYAAVTSNTLLVQRDPGAIPAFQAFAQMTIDQLAGRADEGTVDRVINIMRRDRLPGRTSLLTTPEIAQATLRLALSREGPRRFDRLQNLLRRSGANAKPLLPVDAAMLRLLARTPGDDVDKLLQTLLPSSDDALRQELEALRHQPAGAAAPVAAVTRPTPNEYWQAPASQPDTPSTSETQAMLRQARELLAAPPKSASLEELEPDVAARREVLLELGRTGASKAAALIKPFTQPDFLALYRQAHQSAYEASLKTSDTARRAALRQPESQPLVDDLRMAALLALTRLKDPAATAEWRQLVKGPDVPARVTAAVALCYLGEPDGRELIETFIRHDELSDRSLLPHYLAHGFTAEFQDALAYLRSPRTDEVALKRVANGLDHRDAELVQDVAFFQDHATDLTPLLVRLLDNHEFSTRYQACATLERVLGMSVNWDELAPSGAQPEKVAALRQAADELLKARDKTNLKVK